MVPPASWGDTVVTLPLERAGRQWRNIVTGQMVSATDGSLSVTEALDRFPVALLAAG
jgi:maltooligosyltrehalose synthase